jgi:hypothetical protein
MFIFPAHFSYDFGSLAARIKNIMTSELVIVILTLKILNISHQNKGSKRKMLKVIDEFGEQFV